jgi:hypothetical protein
MVRPRLQVLPAGLLLFVLIAAAPGTATARKNAVGWYISSNKSDVGGDPKMPPERIPWELYTHIVHGSPAIGPVGHASCDKADLLTARLVELATQHVRSCTAAELCKPAAAANLQ